MNIQMNIEKMKEIQKNILSFLNSENNNEEIVHYLIKNLHDSEISKDAHELKTFLYLLSKILNNHHRTPNFFTKIEKIFLIYKSEIEKKFNDYEIYKIFEKNPKFLLFLIKEKIISMNAEILNEIPTKLFNFLFPKEANQKKSIPELPTNYEEKQIIGENEDTISQIIRKDLIEDFITYVNKNNYPLKSYIKESIFESNYFLIRKAKTTLIEYAAFFGSTQIFKYLYKNGIELTPSLWICGIHSDNPEIINLLEVNDVLPPNGSYEKCIKESIKCHHNDIVNYIQCNYINSDFFQFDKEKISSFSFHYYNFSYFPQEINNKINFCYACKYDYFKIVEYFIKNIKIDIKKKIILNIKIF